MSSKEEKTVAGQVQEALAEKIKVWMVEQLDPKLIERFIAELASGAFQRFLDSWELRGAIRDAIVEKVEGLIKEEAASQITCEETRRKIKDIVTVEIDDAIKRAARVVGGRVEETLTKGQRY